MFDEPDQHTSLGSSRLPTQVDTAGWIDGRPGVPCDFPGIAVRVREVASDTAPGRRRWFDQDAASGFDSTIENAIDVITFMHILGKRDRDSFSGTGRDSRVLGQCVTWKEGEDLTRHVEEGDLRTT